MGADEEQHALIAKPVGHGPARQGALGTMLLRAAQLLRRLALVTVCLSWVLMSSGAILVNQRIMVGLQFRYPVTVAWLGLLTTTLVSTVAVRAVIAPADRVHLTTRQYMTRALPVGFFMALTFQTGNLAYLYLTVALIQMLKAFCPVITMVLLFAFKLERPTSQLVGSVVLISAGVTIACWGEVNMSLAGLVAMLTSVVAESVRLVLTQHILVGAQLHPFEGLMYIGGACTMVLTVQAMVWELGPMLRSGALAIPAQYPWYFLLAAVAGVGVNTLAMLVIKLASSLTLKVLGTAKDVALVAVGVLFLHEQVTRAQLNGYSVSVVGLFLYNAVKARSPLQPILPVAKRAA